MITPIISQQIINLVPKYHVGIIEAKVVNSPSSTKLITAIESYAITLLSQYTISSIKERPSIAATRAAYKATGKDPSRYRPSCEQLARRVLQHKELHTISTLVDIGNLVSLQSGYSIAVLDAAYINTDTITLGIGEQNELYEGIGRGLLNIENMPVWRDSIGGFATPTSDHIRTQCSLSTTHVLILINNFEGDTHHLQETIKYIKQLLYNYCEAHDIHSGIFPYIIDNSLPL